MAVDQSVGLTLLFKEKKAALNAVTAAPGISFAFMSEVKVSDANVHCLSLRVNTDKMADFWNWLVTKGSHAAQQRLNVLGVLIQSSCFLYLNGEHITSSLLPKLIECLCLFHRRQDRSHSRSS